jgi:hypothetical protein
LVDDPQSLAEQPPAEQAPRSASASLPGAAGSQDAGALRAKAQGPRQAPTEHGAALDSALGRRAATDEDVEDDIENTADDAAMGPAKQVE